MAELAPPAPASLRATASWRRADQELSYRPLRYAAKTIRNIRGRPSPSPQWPDQSEDRESYTIEPRAVRHRLFESMDFARAAESGTAESASLQKSLLEENISASLGPAYTEPATHLLTIGEDRSQLPHCFGERHVQVQQPQSANAPRK